MCQTFLGPVSRANKKGQRLVPLPLKSDIERRFAVNEKSSPRKSQGRLIAPIGAVAFISASAFFSGPSLMAFFGMPGSLITLS